ncbi:MAG TPA: ATP-binding cassette domain-containing protein [Nocardioidaceae bacterium]|nr:ATP-binding cassette domain-containing protein [Nocardioidaceae bacterium]
MVEAHGLSFGYGGGAGPKVLDGLDYTFTSGAVTVVTGPSGRGKSTLLYLLGLMLRPTAGQVVWRGEQVSEWSDGDRSSWRAREVGFVFQDAVLDPSRSVLENIVEGALYAGLPRRSATARAGELMERFGVQTRSAAKPRQVSGGQAQRVALCRALVKQPAVVLADEPTGNLDEGSAAVVWQALYEEAKRGATVLVATHHLEQVNADAAVLEL